MFFQYLEVFYLSLFHFFCMVLALIKRMLNWKNDTLLTKDMFLKKKENVFLLSFFIYRFSIFKAASIRFLESIILIFGLSVTSAKIFSAVLFTS
jgi:hypothetical protein